MILIIAFVLLLAAVNGDDLSSAQQLQTFGFVEDKFIHGAAMSQLEQASPEGAEQIFHFKKDRNADSDGDRKSHLFLTQAVLSKKEVIEACVGCIEINIKTICTSDESKSRRWNR